MIIIIIIVYQNHDNGHHNNDVSTITLSMVIGHCHIISNALGVWQKFWDVLEMSIIFQLLWLVRFIHFNHLSNCLLDDKMGPLQPNHRQGCISCGILLSGTGARGVSSEHMENVEMFSENCALVWLSENRDLVQAYICWCLNKDIHCMFV